MESAAHTTMWIAPEYRPLLERVGWDSFDAVMGASEGDCWRRFADRENWRFDLPDDGRMRRVHLKKHHVRPWRAWVRAKLGLRPRATPARIERDNVARVRAAGVDSMHVMAMGERFHADGRIESFLLTDDLSDFVELQEFILQRFACPRHEITRGRDRQLDRLVCLVGVAASRFHRAGYNHRDLYAGHFFVREPSEGEYDIRLIDLQRMQLRRRLRRRWLVKDLAQLAWSLPTDDIGCRHRLAFIRHYLGVSWLRPRDKRLVREVVARQQRMQRKLGSSKQHGRKAT